MRACFSGIYIPLLRLPSKGGGPIQKSGEEAEINPQDSHGERRREGGRIENQEKGRKARNGGGVALLAFLKQHGQKKEEV